MLFVFILFLFEPDKSNTGKYPFSTIFYNLYEWIDESIKSSGKTGIGCPVCFTGYNSAFI
jgi:hypothetical protein